MNVTSNYSGAITVASPVYFVDRHDKYGYENVTYKYERIRVIISTYGLYRFECNTDNFAYFVYIGTTELYKNSFYPTNLSMNRLSYKYGGEGIHRSSFGVFLRPGDYILVVSVIHNYEKKFSIMITGPSTVIFAEILQT